MLAIARKQAIREQLQEYKSVRITELAAALNVTKETIRRDLRDMEQAGGLSEHMEAPTFWTAFRMTLILPPGRF